MAASAAVVEPLTAAVTPPAVVPRSGPHRALWAVLGVVLLAVVAVGADMVQANRELGQLTDAAASYQATQRGQERWLVRQLRDESERQSDPETAGAKAADVCARVSGTMSGARANVRDVSILPWHESLLSAKSAMLRYASARIAYYDACTSVFSSAGGTTAAMSRAESEAMVALARLPDAFADAKPLVTLPWWGADDPAPFTE